MSVFTASGGLSGTDDNVTFGLNAAGAPVNAEDNDTYIVTSDGTSAGTVLEMYKYDAESGQWVSVDLDTDISAVNAALAGTSLTVAVTEDGVTLTSIADLSSLLDDTDISAIAATLSGATLTLSVTEDGTTVVDTVDLSSLQSTDTDVSGVAIAAGPNDTPDTPTIQVSVTENGNTVVSNEYALPVCPVEMTRGALRALRTAGGLRKDCHYTMTGYNRGTVGAAKILLHAIDANTLSMQADVLTSFDTLAWDGRYDIDTNRLIALADNIGNEVTGNDSVDTFPWGVALVTDNQVNDGRLTYTAGTVSGVTIGRNSTVNMVDGILQETEVEGDSDVTIRSGANRDNLISRASAYNQVGTGTLNRTTITDESSVTNGNVTIIDSSMNRTVLNMTGSTGTLYYTSMRRVTGNALQNIPVFRIDSCDFSANSQLSATGAARLDLRYSSMQGYGRFLVSAGATLVSQYTGLRDYSYVQVTAGTLTANYCTVQGVSYIQNATPGTNQIERTTITGSSRARFLNTSTGCRIYYCEIGGSSMIEHRGTSTGCYFYQTDVSSASTVYSNNSVNLRAYYNSVSGNSQLYSQAVTATHYMYYNHCAGHGYIWFLNSAGGRIYAVSVHGQAVLRFRGATAAGRIYYSSFTAYYYLYAENWTITRHSLHGYGRRTYTVTNPATNGTYTQNF